MGIIRIENSQHWHDLRSKHLGGSEIAGLMGCSPYHTPNQLVLEKRDMVYHPVGGQLVEFGKIMEPIVAAYLADQYHWKVERSYQYVEHPDYNFLGCTLDYYVIESEHGKGILEIKYVNQFAPDWSQNAMPEHIEWQLQHQLFCINAVRQRQGLKPFQWGAVGSMHGGTPEDIRVYMRAPDARAHSMIAERGVKFWHDMKAGFIPEGLEPPDYAYVSDIFKQAQLLPAAQLLDLRGSNDADALCEEYLRLGVTRRTIEKEEARLKAEIMHKLLKVEDEKLFAHVAADTPSYEIDVNLVQVNYKPSPARVGNQVRFTVKKKEGENGKKD